MAGRKPVRYRKGLRDANWSVRHNRAVIDLHAATARKRLSFPSLGRRATVIVAGASLVGAGLASWWAWFWRDRVAVRSGYECLFDAPWRAHLAWWLLAISALLLLVLSAAAVRSIVRKHRLVAAFPIAAIVLLAAVAFITNSFAWGGIDGSCGAIPSENGIPITSR